MTSTTLNFDSTTVEYCVCVWWGGGGNLGVISILDERIHPPIANAYTLQVFGIDRIALNDNLPCCRNIVPSWRREKILKDEQMKELHAGCNP